MIGILENIQAILKKVRGLFRIKLIWWKGLFWNIIKERVYFAKRLESGRALNGKGKRAGGMGKITLSSSSPRWKTGEGATRRRWSGPAALGARRRFGSGGKGEGVAVGCFPLLNLDGGGARRVAHGGGRRRPWWRRCKARWRPGVGGKGEGDQEGSIPYLGSGSCPRRPAAAALGA